MLLCLRLLLMCAAVLAPAHAHALTFRWSWTVQQDGGSLMGQPFDVGTTVGGTISGLVDNADRQQAGVTVTMDAPITITGWQAAFAGGYDGFDVHNGVITNAFVEFYTDPGDGSFLALVFGNPFGDPSGPPNDLMTDDGAYGLNGPTALASYTLLDPPQTTTAVPEPAAAALLAGALASLAGTRRRVGPGVGG